MTQRVEHIGDATLYLGDCREILPTLGKVDAVIMDAPYGVGVEYGTFDDTPQNVRGLIAELMPMARNISNRVVLTCGIARIWDYPPADWVLCWAISGAGSTGKWGFNCWQPILVYGADPFLAMGLGRRPDLIFKNETSASNGHPCPKPEGFMERLVDRASLNGETICDPLMGSGTTGVACASLGRRFIGIEIHEPYFEIACRRIEEAQRQGRLFEPRPPKAEQMNLLAEAKA